MDRAFFHLDAPVQRLTPPFTPAPFGKAFDNYLNPNADSIADAVRGMLK